VLLGDPLQPLPGLVRLSRALVQNIWQSICLFAFGLNALGVIVCALRWLDPIGAAIFHEIASLAVMINAMRLLWFESSTSSFTGNFINPLLHGADWLVENVSPSKWVFWAIEHWQLGVKLAGATGLALWLMSGIAQLSEDETAIVTRFGRVEEELKAGLHWRWPWPMERLIRERTGILRSVTVGYRQTVVSANKTGLPSLPNQARWGSGLEKWSANKAATGLENRWIERPTIEWTTSHEEGGHSSVADEAVMLTAEEVPVELMAEIQYRIRDLRVFVLAGSQRPDELLRATAESVLRELAASSTLDDLLTDQRARLERQSLATMRDRIERYALGIELVDMQWLDVHPPQAVVPAYRQVADALEDRELLINEAEAYASRTLMSAVGERAFLRLQTSGRDQAREVANSPNRIDWELDDGLWARLLETDSEGRPLLSGSAAAILLDGELARIRNEQSARGTSDRFERLYAEHLQYADLTSQHLYWTVITEMLSKRSLMIIDPKASGKQQLWLNDPIPSMAYPGPRVTPALPRETEPK
jgi:Cu+-exporting ATPase